MGCRDLHRQVQSPPIQYCIGPRVQHSGAPGRAEGTGYELDGPGAMASCCDLVLTTSLWASLPPLQKRGANSTHLAAPEAGAAHALSDVSNDSGLSSLRRRAGVSQQAQERQMIHRGMDARMEDMRGLWSTFVGRPEWPRATPNGQTDRHHARTAPSNCRPPQTPRERAPRCPGHK